MALDLIGGAVFSVLYDGVKQAIGRTETFKELLRDLKFTLECLRRQATAIQEIGRYNVELGLQNDEIEELERQMHRGARLVGKLLNFRLWNYCCINCYTDQLVDLDRSLRRLLENLMLQEIRDVKEILDLSRKNREELKEVKEAQVSMHKLLQQIAGSIVIEEASTSAAAGGDAIEMVALNEGNGGIQVASLDGRAGTALGEIFGMLLEVVIDVKDRNVMFKPLLEDLKSTLESLKPLVKEIAQNNTVLDRPNEELKTFAMKMEDGVKLVCKCSKVRLWASYKKYQYTNKILGLDEFCRRQLSMLKEQVARDVRETSASIRNVKEEMLDFIRNIEMVLKRMKLNTGVAQEPYDKDQSTSIPECYETVADYGRRKNVVTKRHLPGIGGGAPFIACYKCSHLLQMPAGFRLSRRKWHKLKCGACSAVLKFLLGKNSQLLPYEVLSAKKPPTDEVDRRPDSQHEELDSSNDFVDSPLHYHSPKKGLSYYNVDTGTSDSPQSVSRTSDIWTTDLESRGETTYRASIDSNTSSGAGTSLFSEEKTSTLRRKDDDDQSTNWPYSEGIQAERLPWEVKNTDSYTTSVAGTSLFSEEETSTFRSKDDNQSTDGHILETSNLRDFKFAELEIATRHFSPDVMIVDNSSSSVELNHAAERILASPLRVPPSPRYTNSPKLSRLGSVHLNLNQIARATRNFSKSQLIGEGGFGTVYKARLADGQVVCIKRAKKELFENLQTEFSSEVELLAKIDHRNLIKLLGYVDEGNERLIITEYVPNGNLREHLDGQVRKTLECNQRLEIAIDVAHALTYLHLYAEKPIIHRDVKSSNILLTESMRAKVADFGFARLGTVGYLDPEYVKTYQLTAKSDVYSFGILLVEIVTGRRPVELKRPVEERVTLRWAFKKLNEGRTMELIDPAIKEAVDADVLMKIFDLAIQCAAPVRADRPDMKAVGEQLWTIRADYLKSLKRG